MGNNLSKFPTLFSPVRNCDVFYPELLSAAVIFLVIVLYRSVGFSTKSGSVGGVLLVAGGLANLVERLLSGCVWDYFDFFGLFSFNVFDLMVILGAGLLIYGIWKKKS